MTAISLLEQAEYSIKLLFLDPLRKYVKIEGETFERLSTVSFGKNSYGLLEPDAHAVLKRQPSAD